MMTLWTEEELAALKRNLEHIDDSAIFLSMVGKSVNDLDPKGCMELGAAIILGKPLLVVAHSDDDISGPLRAAAAAVVIGDPKEDDLKAKIVDAIETLIGHT
jgi:hypothetical protein